MTPIELAERSLDHLESQKRITADMIARAFPIGSTFYYRHGTHVRCGVVVGHYHPLFSDPCLTLTTKKGTRVRVHLGKESFAENRGRT